MLKKRQELENRDLSWQKKGLLCWVYNNNILPGKRIFLPIIIDEEPSEKESKIAVILSYNKFASSFKIERNLVYQNSGLEIQKIEEMEDISNLPVVNRPEIFNYLLEREKAQFHFFCGLDLYFINNFKKIEINDMENEIYFLHNKQLYKEEDFVKKEAYNWMIDERTLKPKNANSSLFIASIFKNFMMSFEKQIICLNGEYQSGKSLHLYKFIEFLVFINNQDQYYLSAQLRQNRISEFQVKKRASIETVFRDSFPNITNYKINQKPRNSQINKKNFRNSIIEKELNNSKLNQSLRSSQINQSSKNSQIDKSIRTSQINENNRGSKVEENNQKKNSLLNESQISFRNDKFSKNKDGYIIDINKIYFDFNKYIFHAFDIIKPFINKINVKGSLSQKANLRLIIKCDKSFKFTSFKFKVDFLQSDIPNNQVI